MAADESEEYRRALDAAVREYEALGAQRQELDRRLGEIAQTIFALYKLCGMTPTVQWGLTDACRTVLRNAGVPMTAIEVRDRLKVLGMDLSRYSSDIAAVHTILKRLNDAAELRSVLRDGKTAYAWEKPSHAPGLGPDIAAIARERQVERRLMRGKRTTK